MSFASSATVWYWQRKYFEGRWETQTALVYLAVWREDLVWWNWSRYKQIWSSCVWFFRASVVWQHSETLIKTSEAVGNKWCVSGAAVECGGTMKSPSGSLIARLISELQGSLPVFLCENTLKTYRSRTYLENETIKHIICV